MIPKPIPYFITSDNFVWVDGIMDFKPNTPDDYIENYEETSKTYSPNLASIETQVILNCVQIIIGNLALSGAASVIDVGCGAGHVINALSVNQRLAVDISLNQLKSVSEDVTRIRASG